MTEVIYYVAMSLDGYIATPDGGVDWLSPFEEEDEAYGYPEFYASIDVLLMGRRTYKQILTFGAWPYKGKPCWVFSRRPLEAATAEVTVTSSEPKEVLSDLHELGLHRAWLVGGAAVATTFRSMRLIDEYVVSVIPTILGRGIPLLNPGEPSEKLSLVESKEFEIGLVQLRYRKNIDA
jgi:dihydrofolate reductase